jgi:large subunit ribosomal protein L29
MTTTELRAKSDRELRDTATKLRADLFDVRFRREVDQVADLNVLGTTRRFLARVLTVLRERELGIRRGGASK